MKGIIYKATLTLDNRCYIGQTTQELSKRKYRHKWNSTQNKLNSNNHFYNAINLYGFDSFIWEIIETVECKNQDDLKCTLNQLEIDYITKYNSYNLGFNSNFGGGSNLGFSFSEESRNKISISNSGKTRTEETKLKISESRKGYKRSEESKVKQSKARKGKSNTKSYKIVLQYDLNGTFIKEWPSIISASKELNISSPSITYCCKGKYKSAGKYKWKYKEE